MISLSRDGYKLEDNIKLIYVWVFGWDLRGSGKGPVNMVMKMEFIKGRELCGQLNDF